jgi:hypothetical protein
MLAISNSRPIGDPTCQAGWLDTVIQRACGVCIVIVTIVACVVQSLLGDQVFFYVMVWQELS